MRGKDSCAAMRQALKPLKARQGQPLANGVSFTDTSPHVYPARHLIPGLRLPGAHRYWRQRCAEEGKAFNGAFMELFAKSLLPDDSLPSARDMPPAGGHQEQGVDKTFTQDGKSTGLCKEHSLYWADGCPHPRPLCM